MAARTVPRLHQQINGVRWRLFLQSLLNHLIFCWAGTLLLAAAWFAVQPFVLGGPEQAMRWAVLGGAMVLGTAAGGALALLRAPSRLEAALALDERFGLKERVTTALMLTEEQAASPAGQALLTDVEQRIAGIAVGSKFPLQVSWRRALVPLGAAAVAVLAVFFEPDLSFLRGDSRRSSTLSAAQAREIENKLLELKKVKKNADEKDAPTSKDLKELDAEWNKLLEQQVDPKNPDQLREHVQKMRDLEEKMKNELDKLKTLNEKKNKLQDQLDQLEALARKAQEKNGPAKDLLDALKKKDDKKLKEELEKLQKKLENNELNKDELKKLEDQLNELKKELERLKDERDRRKEQLEREKEAGGLDDKQLEELERELEQLEEMENIEDLLEQCQNCLREGSGKKMSGKLKDLIARMKRLKGKIEEIKGELKQLELSEKELKELEEAALLLQQTREQICRGLGQCDGNGLGNGKFPGTRRPKGNDEKTGEREERQKAETDPAGHLKITGFSRGGSFKKVPREEVPGVFRRTAQEAQQVIETQRIAPEAAEMLKGYYENLGGQKKQ